MNAILRHPSRLLTVAFWLSLLLTEATVYGAPYSVFLPFATNTSLVAEFPRSEPTVSYWSISSGQPPYIFVATAFGGPAGQGRLIQMRADGSSMEDIFFFDAATAKGIEPQGPLNGPGLPIPGIIPGMMFGTCRRGGTADVGCVFRIRYDGVFHRILYSFAADGRDGRFPNGGLTYFPSDGFFYGTTPEGGINSGGTLFRIKPDGSSYTVLRHFAGSESDGRSPNGSLAIMGSYLFGTTFGGGIDDLGTIFRYQPSSQAYSVRWHFGSDVEQGTLPAGGLIRVLENFSTEVLYGLAGHGGTNEAGTLYRYVEIGESYRAMTVRRHFGVTSTDARHPRGRLTFSSAFGDRLIGTSTQGGDFNKGTVFAIGSNPEVLHSFSGGEEDGELPLAGVALCEGVAVGVTSKGGPGDAGVLFKVGLGYGLPQKWSGAAVVGTTTRFQLQGDPQVRYTVQSSPAGNPTNWSRFGTLLANDSGQVTLTINLATNAPGHTGRLFRFVWP